MLHFKCYQKGKATFDTMFLEWKSRLLYYVLRGTDLVWLRITEETRQVKPRWVIAHKQVLSLLTFVSMKECTYFPWLSVPCKLQHCGAVEAHHTTWFVAHDISHSTFKFLLLFTLWETVTCVTQLWECQSIFTCFSSAPALGRLEGGTRDWNFCTNSRNCMNSGNPATGKTDIIMSWQVISYTHTHTHGQWTSFGAKAKLSSPLLSSSPFCSFVLLASKAESPTHTPHPSQYSTHTHLSYTHITPLTILLTPHTLTCLTHTSYP